MELCSELLLVVVALVVQVAGLTSMAIARVCETSERRVRYERFFFLCLLLVGVFAALLINAHSDYKLCCAATLPVMVVGATLDMRKAPADEII